VSDRGLHQRLGRSERLRKRSGFLAVQECGRRASGRTLVLYALERKKEETQKAACFGITVSRKVGTAVVRNRVKRWVRESYRRLLDAKPSGVDVVVIAKPSAAGSSYQATAAELRKLLLSIKST
jgi:ribonuclease P protein component